MTPTHTTAAGGFLHACSCGRPERWFLNRRDRDDWSNKHRAEHEKKEGK